MNSEKAYYERLEIQNKILKGNNKLLIQQKAKMYEDLDELSDRIQKAIEYIENNRLYKEEIDYDYEENPIYVGCNDIKAREELLDILKGGKNE